jgi:[acyl-carrier-protein] S-malonyltransferase
MKIALLFPGYGSQFVGMAKELYDESRLVQEYFEEASNCLNINFVKLCFASSEYELGKIENAYVAIFLVGSSLAALLRQEGINPDLVVGYDLGEYTAISAAGGLSLPDGLYFLSKYAQFYGEVLDNLEVRAIKIDGLSPKKVKEICNLYANSIPLTIAAYISTDSCIVTGITGRLSSLEEHIEKDDIRVTEMPVEAGLHSDLMNPVVEHLAAYLEKIDFNDLVVPLISNIDGRLLNKRDEIKTIIMKKLTHPVHWDKAIAALKNYDLIIEIGPGTTLRQLVMQEYPEKKVISVNKPTDIVAVKEIIYGMNTTKSEINT